MKPTVRIGRKPHAHVCPCQATILTAWDADAAALLVDLDPWALTPQGEQWAIAEGLRTYHLNAKGVHRRWVTPAASATFVVVSQHRCGVAVPEQYRLKRTAQPKPRITMTDEVSF